jgi:hypothetical protein
VITEQMTAGHVTSQATSHVTKHVTKRHTDHVASKVQADDGSWIPSTYRDFLDIFSKKKAETLPPHRPTDHAIDLEPDTKLPYGRIYSLSEVELKALATASAYTGILVVVDRLTKMAINLPCRKEVDSPELARMFFEEVICKHGVPSNIVTDRGSQFTSRFWNRVCSHLSIDHRLSTSFHPQTDGQTERQNQTMEQYLRAFATYEQDNWVDLLPLAEFAYNNSVHATTRLTPFFANYGYHPEMHFKPPKDARFRSERAADERLGKLQAARNRLRESILEAQERQTRYAGGKEMTFEVGDKVWLSAKHI